MKGYNGFRNWTHWNVSLWLNNDEGLYREMRRYCRLYNRNEAAKRFYNFLVNVCENTCTPDGARYSVTAIRAAMVGI